MEVLFNLGYMICSLMAITFCFLYFLFLCNFLGRWQGLKYGRDARARVLAYRGLSTAFLNDERNLIKRICRKKRFHIYEIQYVDGYVGDTQIGYYITKENNLQENEEVAIKHVLGRYGRVVVIQDQTIPWLKRIVICYTCIVLLLIIVAIVMTILRDSMII